MTEELFGIYTNLILVLIVTLYGTYWLFKRQTDVELEYRYRAYRYWWCSWLAWVIVWLLLTTKQSRDGGADAYSLELDIPVLIFDNLNSIFLIIVYFILTRGRDLTARQARVQTVKITLSLAITYGSLYLVFQQQPHFAYEVHRTCSLCVAVFTPILVGWAFNLRFKTSLVLMVGCLYGFTQPIVYATQLRTFQQSEFKQMLDDVSPIVAMVMGLLKVMWAIACTKVLSSGRASSKNLIRNRGSELVPFWKGWRVSVSLHATILVATYCVMLIMLTLWYIDRLGGFATALGVVTGVFSFWQMIWNVWKTTRRQ